MADARLNSGHLEWINRRIEYRRAREELLRSRGVLTLATEEIRGWIGEPDQWPSQVPVRPDQPAPGAKYFLVDRETGYYFPVKTGLNTIGRNLINDIVLNDLWISRRHCVLLAHARGGCELHDTASRNGTFVNGKRIRGSVKLASGDWVQVCRRLFVFLHAEADEADQADEAEFDYGSQPDTQLP